MQTLQNPFLGHFYPKEIPPVFKSQSYSGVNLQLLHHYQHAKNRFNSSIYNWDTANFRQFVRGFQSPLFKVSTPWLSWAHHPLLFQNLCFPFPLFWSTRFKVFQTVPPHPLATSSYPNPTHQLSLHIINGFNKQISK